ncbi:hypothetical protein TIFTF001_020567 [Ficus carica]|uniref:Uncharacterized protein n=1 Tax=Ficus carica TaxID=3494 RepID=A0AA88AAZ5_FICCA|nr:hypothetical protein TIFTF001_020567 [Ficus carica]
MLWWGGVGIGVVVGGGAQKPITRIGVCGREATTEAGMGDPIAGWGRTATRGGGTQIAGDKWLQEGGTSLRGGGRTEAGGGEGELSPEVGGKQRLKGGCG